MTDLNKEREAFLNTFQYYKGRRDIIFSHEHELFMTRSNNPSEIAQKEISNMNSRWDAWLRCAKHRDAELEKAKTQAVSVWISTDFMKPDDNDCVDILINGKRRIVDAVYLDGKFFIFPPFSKEQWTEVNNKVTHWIPRVEILSESGAEG